MIVYISGCITNGGTQPVTDAIERFAAAEQEVATLGHTPLNPCDVAITSWTWRQCMNRAVRLLLEADGIYLLRGWENSHGARVEKQLAQGLGMTVLYQPECAVLCGAGVNHGVVRHQCTLAPQHEGLHRYSCGVLGEQQLTTQGESNQ